MDYLSLKRLPWYEQVIQVKNLHDRKCNENLPSTRGKGKRGWSLRDTAIYLGTSVGWVSESLKLARELEKNPTFKKLQDRESALKFLSPKPKCYLKPGTEVQILSSDKSSFIFGTIVGAGYAEKQEVYIVKTDRFWIDNVSNNLIAVYPHQVMEPNHHDV